MFKLDYKIVHSEYDDFIGQNGFLQIECNGCKYGEIYPEKIEMIMDKVSLYDWFERLVKVVKNLMTKDYIALSDVESYNTWIEFCRKNEEIMISIVKAEKEQGSQDIAFYLKQPVVGAWGNQIISYSQLKTEVIEKANEYIEVVATSNKEIEEIIKMKENLESLQKI